MISTALIVVLVLTLEGDIRETHLVTTLAKHFL